MKIEIMKSKPDLNEEEIRGYMDFDNLAKRRELAMKKEVAAKKLKISSFFASLLVVSGLVFYFLRPQAEVNSPLGTPSSTHSPAPGTAPDEKPSVKAEPSATQRPEKSAVTKNTVAAKTHERAEPKVRRGETPPADVYNEAQPVNGFVHLYNYFQDNLHYPAGALKDSIEGVESISFTISETGQPEGYKILQSLGPAFDEEVVRLVDHMPSWKPATMNGHPVASKISLPFTFSIDLNKKSK
jgi:TonB family protein